MGRVWPRVCGVCGAWGLEVGACGGLNPMLAPQTLQGARPPALLTMTTLPP